MLVNFVRYLLPLSLCSLAVLVLQFCQPDDRKPLYRIRDSEVSTVFYHGEQPTIPISQLFDFEDYILLDSTHLLGSITKAIIQNDRIYIGDLKNTMSIMVFDLKGCLQYKIDLKKQYNASFIFDFSVLNNGNLAVLMDPINKIHIFTADGKLASVHPLPFRAFKIQAQPDNRILMYGYQDYTRKYVFTQWIDYTGKAISGVAEFENFGREVCPAYANLNYPLHGNEPLFGIPLNDTLFRVYPHEIKPVVRFDFGQRTVQDKTIFGEMSYPEMLQHLSLSDNRYGIDIIYESEHYIHLGIIDEKYWKSVYYEKNTGKIQIIGKESDDLFNGHFAHILYATMPGDRFVFILEPMKLHLSAENDAHAIHPLLQEIKAKTNKLSNPVLLIGKIRQHSNPI